MTPQELRQRWTELRDTYERVGAWVEGARIIDAFLADLTSIERTSNDRLLTLREAAELSGYSTDHLARLVRQAVIPNAGKRHSPRIRLGDLPRRPKSFAHSQKRSYDAITDARSLGVRR